MFLFNDGELKFSHFISNGSVRHEIKYYGRADSAIRACVAQLSNMKRSTTKKNGNRMVKQCISCVNYGPIY